MGSNLYIERYKLEETIIQAQKLEDSLLMELLKERLEEVNNEIEMDSIAISNGVISLKRKNPNHDYRIMLYNTDTEIGHIEFYGYHHSKEYGDIHCEIYEQYRGCHYASQALLLLGQLLYQQQILDVWINAKINNRTSLRVIEENGGQLIGGTNTYLRFEWPTQSEYKRV